MSIEELKKRFIVDQDVVRTRLEPLVEKAIKHCVIDNRGQVHVTETKLSARDQVMLVLTARAIACQLQPEISNQVNVADIVAFTGLPADQVRARGKELIQQKLADSPDRGVYRALPHKIEDFLDSLESSATPRSAKSPRSGTVAKRAAG